MDAELIAKYDGLRVPRYTSFPTAPHFGPAVDSGAYAGWLAALDASVPASLYIHVPFCRSMCWYCGCHTKIVARYNPIAGYLESLRQEIALVAARLPGRLSIRHLHFGGGTPTMIAAADFATLLDTLRQTFDFTADAEIAIEADPRTLAAAAVPVLAAAGVNRASLGVQDFDPVVQQAINRIQPYQVTADAVAALRAAGIAQVNLDLMYGLPHQTVASCRASAERALTLRPERLAVFGYAHVPWMKKHQQQIDEARLPDSVERWRQFDAIAETLAAAGYVQIGLDHFARADDPISRALADGTLKRNFQGYTVDDAPVLIGLGASSIGALPQGYVQNTTAIGEYQAAVAAGTLPTARGRALTAEDRLRRDLIERLMCDLTVAVDEVAARHGIPAAFFDADLDRLHPLAADGLAHIDGWRITVPEAVRPLVRIVAAAFDPYLERSQAAGAARHARAI